MLPTLLDPPPDALARAMEVWRLSLSELHRTYTCGIATPAAQREASLWAYTLPGLLLRRLPRQNTGEQQHGCVPLKTALSHRLKRAEVAEENMLRELLQEYLAERSEEHRRAARQEPRVQADTLDGWSRAVKSVQGDCVARARREATGQRWAPRDDATRQEMLRLAAAPIPDGERAALEAEVQALFTEIARAKAPRKASIRRRIFGPTFRRGAAPGPSATRNAYLAGLASIPGGVDALHSFALLEVRGAWSEEDHRLWHAGILEPADCGERSPGDEAQAPPRKLRPLAQTEVLIKLVETTLIDEAIEELRAAFEPRQLGVVTPDGPVRTGGSRTFPGRRKPRPAFSQSSPRASGWRWRRFWSLILRMRTAASSGRALSALQQLAPGALPR